MYVCLRLKKKIKKIPISHTICQTHKQTESGWFEYVLKLKLYFLNENFFHFFCVFFLLLLRFLIYIDTFASKVAAIQDKYADASVGNVTGSNAVNVFLGIGVAWTIGNSHLYLYTYIHQFRIHTPINPIALSKNTLFCCCCSSIWCCYHISFAKEIESDVKVQQTVWKNKLERSFRKLLMDKISCIFHIWYTYILFFFGLLYHFIWFVSPKYNNHYHFSLQLQFIIGITDLYLLLIPESECCILFDNKYKFFLYFVLYNLMTKIFIAVNIFG